MPRENYKFNFVYTGIFVLILYSCISFVILGNKSYYESWALITSVLATIEMLQQQYTLSHFKIPFTDFRRVFLIFHYVFFFGRIIVYGYMPNAFVFWDLIGRFNNETLLKMGLFSICAIQAIFIGLFYNKRSITFDNNIKSTSLRSVGFICLFIGVPSQLITDYYRIKSTYSAGSYGELQLNLGIIDDLSVLSISGIILLVCSNTLSKRIIRIMILSALSYFFFVMIFSGDRRYQMSAIICLFVLFIKKTESITINSPKRLFVIFICGLLTLNLLYIIRENRISNLRSIISEISNNPLRLLSFEAFFETLVEFGISFFSLCNIGKFFPSVYPFQLGRTFMYSFASLLPLGLMGDTSFYDYASYSTILNRDQKLRVGATLIGDFYSNFGWFSCIFILLFCIFISSLIFHKSKTGAQWDEARYFILYYVLASSVRATFAQEIRPIIIGILFPWILVYLFGARKRKNTD